MSTTDFETTNLTADNLDVASSKFVVDSNGSVTASTSIASSGAVTCGSVDCGGSVSAKNGFYVE